MESMQCRTGLEYERVMVFPRGILRRIHACLKLNNFVSAVNTEYAPVGIDPSSTNIARPGPSNMEYGDFPLFRRYMWHGIENFA
jgi:hypothetical protein